LLITDALCLQFGDLPLYVLLGEFGVLGLERPPNGMQQAAARITAPQPSRAGLRYQASSPGAGGSAVPGERVP
jgi:hypothetical protein